MKLETVITNLERTIAGKRSLLEVLNAGTDLVSSVSAQFVELNTAELERILADIRCIGAHVGSDG